MGIFATLLSLSGCGYGNKRPPQDNSFRFNVPVTAQITLDKLPDVLRNVQAGRTQFDFTGICSDSVKCIYFMQDNGKFYIDFEAIIEAQLPYLDTLKQFARKHGYPVVETTYHNTPVDYDRLKYAPVLSIRVDADADSIVRVGRLIEQTVFSNNDRTVYDLVP